MYSQQFSLKIFSRKTTPKALFFVALLRQLHGVCVCIVRQKRGRFGAVLESKFFSGSC